jgi:hypothetical protein
MPTDVKAAEGPWTDEEGRPCLGVWADEGGQLLVLRHERNGARSFHAIGPAGRDTRVTTISTFRLTRIGEFLIPAFFEEREADKARIERLRADKAALLEAAMRRFEGDDVRVCLLL